MNDLLVLLLPLAAFTGWWLARGNTRSEKDTQRDEAYFKGLGYLLDDETDKAIDIFVKIAHLDKSAIGNQITLGNIFRLRGEVDRALHIHNSLKESSNIPQEILPELNLALADDYYQAGIMDRSETYYQNVISSNNADARTTARKKLIKLLAEQNKWQNAIDICQDVDPFKHNQDITHNASHYYCELAEIAISDDNQVNAKELLQQALECDKNCFRANIMLGKLAMQSHEFIAAIAYFQAVEKQNDSFLLEILGYIEGCYKSLNQEHEWFSYLKKLDEQRFNPTICLYIANYLYQHNSQDEALQYLQQKLVNKPDFLLLKHYLELYEKQNLNANLMNNSDANNDDASIKTDFAAINLTITTFKKILSVTLKYKCKQCGFRGNKINWQCPGCKSWGEFAPVSELGLKENSN